MSLEPQQRSQETSSTLLAQLYKGRKKAFMESLQSILIKLSEDRIVKQMLADRTSGQFITRRVEEIIGQILYDDREAYIDTILKKLNQYEQLYSKESSARVKALGQKILSISDAQNAGEIQAARRIKALQEQVQALQDEVVTLRAKKVEQVDVQDKLVLRTLQQDFNPTSPTFLHIMATVDVTDVDTKLKLIQTDAKSSHKLFEAFVSKTVQMMRLSKDKAIESARLYSKRIAAYERSMSKESVRVAEVQRHYDEKIIPDLLAKHKAAMSKHKKLEEQHIKEIESLRAQLRQCKDELSALNESHKELQATYEAAKIKEQKDREQINELLDTVSKNKAAIDQQGKAIQDKDKAYSRLQMEKEELVETVDQMTDENKNLHTELDQAEIQIDQLKSELGERNHALESLTDDHATANADLQRIKHQLNDANTQNRELQKQCSQAAQKISRLEPQLAQTKTQLDETNKKLDDAEKELVEKRARVISQAEEIHDQAEQIKILESGNNEISANVKQLSSKLQEVSRAKDAAQAEVNQLKPELKAANTSNEKMKKELAAKTKENQELQTKNEMLTKDGESLREQVKSLSKQGVKNERDLKQKTQDLEAAQAEIEQLSNTKVQQADQLEAAQDEVESLRAKLENVSNQLKEAQSDRQTAASETRGQIRQLNNKIDELDDKVRSLTKQKQRNEATINDQNDQISQYQNTLNKLKSIIPSKTDAELVLQAEEIKHKFDELDGEKKKIADILNNGGSRIDLVQTVQSYIDKQKELESQLDSATEFITGILSIITANQAPAKLVFPLKPTVKATLTDLVSKFQARALNDRKAIEAIIERARSLGYDGSALDAAVEYIIQRKTEVERQQTLSMVNKELDGVREALEKEQEMHKKDKEKAKKRMEAMKATIAQQQATATTNEDELNAQIRQLEAKIRQLSDDLKNEKAVRDELGRIGAGASANIDYLKTKLNSNELRFITMVQALIKSNQVSQELLEKQRMMREGMLGGDSQSSSRKPSSS